MRILAFDPGEMTGVAINVDGIFLIGMTVVPKMFGTEAFYLSLMKLAKPDVVVIEMPPAMTRFPNKTQEDVYNQIFKWFTIVGVEVRAIMPGQWKKLVKRSKISNEHVRDAADMALWYHRTATGAKA